MEDFRVRAFCLNTSENGRWALDGWKGRQCKEKRELDLMGGGRGEWLKERQCNEENELDLMSGGRDGRLKEMQWMMRKRTKWAVGNACRRES